MSKNGEDIPEMPLAKALRDKEEVQKVPSSYPRRTKNAAGMSPEEWRPTFIESLKKIGVIEKACEKAFVCSATVRRHMEADPAFAEEVKLANQHAYANLEAVLIDRATNGHYEEELDRNGTPTKVLRVDNKLGTFIIERILRTKYGKDPSTVINNSLTVNNLNWSL